jgi:glycosyltransferase involved in cell wall biosynthesis
MQEKMAIPPEKMHVVHIGVKPGNYTWSAPADAPPALGYLSRICEENGFEILVEAFILLKRDPRFKELKLKATGGMTGDDKPFIHRQMKKLEQQGIGQDFEIIENFTTEDLAGFFKSVSVLSVPVLKGEAFGLYQVEALASGVPLIQPELGAFPEIIGATGGGRLYHPNTAEALSSKLAEVLSDPAALEQMSRSGRKSIEEHFDCRILSGKMVKVYEKAIKEHS